MIRTSHGAVPVIYRRKRFAKAGKNSLCPMRQDVACLPYYDRYVENFAEPHLRDDLEMESDKTAASVLSGDICSEAIGFGGGDHEVVDEEIEYNRPFFIREIESPAEDFLFADFVAHAGNNGFGLIVRDLR